MGSGALWNRQGTGQGTLMCTLKGHPCQARLWTSWAIGAFVFMGPFLHQKKKETKNYILRPCWCKDECNPGWIPYYVFNYYSFFPLLIVKEIETFFGGAPTLGHQAPYFLCPMDQWVPRPPHRAPPTAAELEPLPGGTAGAPTSPGFTVSQEVLALFSEAGALMGSLRC